VFIECPKCQTKYLFEMNSQEENTASTSKCETCGEVFNVIWYEDNIPTQITQKQNLLKIPENKNIYLEIVKGPNKGNIYQILKPVIAIGRGSQVDLTISEAAVSRKHCVIEIFSQETILRDLGSTNGTLISGQKISSVSLQDQTGFDIGDTRICYIEVAKSK